MHEESRQNQSVSKWNGCVKSGVKKKMNTNVVCLCCREIEAVVLHSSPPKKLLDSCELPHEKRH